MAPSSETGGSKAKKLSTSTILDFSFLGGSTS
jgi:hypothetical protein